MTLERHIDEIYEELLRLHENDESAALATVTRTKGSTPGRVLFKMLVYADGRTLGTVGGGTFEAKVINEALRVIRNGKPKFLRYNFSNEIENSKPICGGQMEAFIEPTKTKPTMYIMGSGHIAEALARIGKIVGFRIVVVDDRERYANLDRFPDAEEIRVMDFCKVAADVELNESSYVVIVTRGHEYDKEVLSQVISSNAKYIGMVGSRKKVKEIFKSLISEGVDSQSLRRVYAPIGLNIGAQTPAEIAISIMAQIIACDKAMNGKSLTFERAET